MSFDSYIKPQLDIGKTESLQSCISFDSYIKPQLYIKVEDHRGVVYLLIPTSNHNSFVVVPVVADVVYLLIPTSNHNKNDEKPLQL